MEKSTKGILIALAIIVALVGVGAFIYHQTKPKVPQITNNGAITLEADKPESAQVYVDPGCMDCRNFLAGNLPTFNDQKVNANFHVLGYVDEKHGGQSFSTSASNAVYCVAANSPDTKWWNYLQNIFQLEPDVQDNDPLGNQWLIQQAHAIGVNNADKCINEGTYNDYVKEITEDAMKNGINWVPTVNGKQYKGTDKLPATL